MTLSQAAGTERRATAQTVLALFAILAMLFTAFVLVRPAFVQAAPPPHTVFAITTDCSLLATDKQIDWSGNDSIVMGSMHSNGGITVSGDRNNVTGAVTYNGDPDPGCEYVISDSSANTGGLLTETSVEPQTPPTYPAPTCTFSFTGNVDLHNEDVWEADGITMKTGTYCTTGLLQQSRNLAQGTVSFYSTGNIDLASAQSVDYTPHRADGVLIHSTANTDVAVTVAGSGLDQVPGNSDHSFYRGIIYAPNGDAETGGSHITLGCILAETVKLNGNFHILEGCGAAPPAPSISIDKANNTTGPVPPGTSVNYTLTLDVTNGPVPNVTIVDELPDGIGAATAVSDGGTYSAATNDITWILTDVADGETLTYTAVVSASATAGTYTNTATITVGPCTGDGCDDTSVVTVEIPPPAPSISIDKANSTEGDVTPGTSVNYTLTLDVTNGPVPNVTIVDELPDGIGAATAVSDGGTYSAATNDITWVLTNVADGETLTYTAVVSASATAGTYTNTATITVGPCTGDGCNDDSIVTVVIPPPGPLAVITKTNNTTGPVAPGTAVNYTLVLDVTNGPVPNMTIVDQLPTGIGAATAISDGGTYSAATNRITWNLTNVADNETLTYTATVSAAAASGTYTNTATITVGPCVGDGCDDTSPVVVVRTGTAGGNPSPTPAIPNTAMGDAIGAPVTVPILLVVALLIGSLGALAFANVRSMRRRQV